MSHRSNWLTSIAYINGDYPSQLPLKLPAAGLVFEASSEHYALQNDEEWGSVFPTNGFTDLGPNNRTFHVSMIHQLHCLDVIRVSFLIQGPGAAEHVEHCLRYLRQALLCHADTTLEEARVIVSSSGETEYGASGIGMVHRCRDWTVLRRYLQDHPATV